METLAIAHEKSRKSFIKSQPHNPEDHAEHVFALGGEVGESEIPNEHVFAVSILVTEHIICSNTGKMLLRSNTFLGHTAYRLLYSANDGVCETFPLDILDNKELLDSAFALWDPLPHPGGEPNTYKHFSEALKAAKLLLQ